LELLQWVGNKRRSKVIGTLQEFPTRASMSGSRITPASARETSSREASNGEDLVEQYRAEKMPTRLDTHRGYESWIRVHILPKWWTKA